MNSVKTILGSFLKFPVFATLLATLLPFGAQGKASSKPILANANHLTINAPAKEHKVILISIDGATTADFEKFKNNILNNYTFKKIASKIGSPTITYPVHASIITGLDYTAHGILSNVKKDGKYAAEYTLLKGQTLFNQHPNSLALRWPTTLGMPGAIPEVYNFDKENKQSLLDSFRPFEKYGLSFEMMDLFNSPLTIDSAMAEIVKNEYKVHPLTAVHFVSLDSLKHAKFNGDNSIAFASNPQIEEMFSTIYNDEAVCKIVLSDHGILEIKNEIPVDYVFTGNKITYDTNIYIENKQDTEAISQLKIDELNRVSCTEETYRHADGSEYKYKCEPPANTVFLYANKAKKYISKKPAGYHGISMAEGLVDLETRIAFKDCQGPLSETYSYEDVYTFVTNELSN